jgi:hypothetical protein
MPLTPLGNICISEILAVAQKATTDNKTPDLLLVIVTCCCSLLFVARHERKDREQRGERLAMSGNSFHLRSKVNPVSL